MADLEARVAALEAERVDYRAVLAAVNALGANQRELNIRAGEVDGRLTSVETRLTSVEATTADTNTRVRSLEDNMAEFRDLLVRALDR